MAEAQQQEPITMPKPAAAPKENKKPTKSADKRVSVFTPAQYRTWRIEKREKWSAWYRLYFHTLASALCVVLSMILGYSGTIIYLSHLRHTDGSTAAALSLIMNQPPTWLSTLLGLVFIPIDALGSSWAFFFITMIPAFSWFYTTVTQEIKKGYKTMISWKSPRGRRIALFLSASSFMGMFCGFMGWYIDTHMFDFFDSIRSPQTYLVVNSMTSFGYILLFTPPALCLYGMYASGKEFYQNEVLRKQFNTWEFSPLARQSFNLTDNKCDVVVGWDKKTQKPIVIKEANRMLHEMVCGATGSGKTSTALLIRIVQDLIRIARGQKLGVAILEPKGDMINDVLALCKKLGIPDRKIKVIDPLNLAQSLKFNPLAGPDISKVAETFKGTLNALAGDQDAFFKGQQEETAANYVKLGKIFFTDKKTGKDTLTLRELQQMFIEPPFLAEVVSRTRTRIENKTNDPATTEEEKNELLNHEDIVRYFENEVLSFKTYRINGEEIPTIYPTGHKYAGRQQVESKKDAFITGGKKYLNELVMNPLLTKILIPKEGEETLDLDKFLDEGGVLLVNSALGDLDELSMLLGQFFIRQFQSAVFRRPYEVNPNGEPTGYKRIPIFFTIDEFPLYINEAFERMLTLGRSFKVGTLIAMQSLGQLDSVRPGYDKVIKSNARNKTVFGGGEKDDNQWFSEQFGEEYQIEESLNESTTPVTVENPTWGFRYNTQRSLVARFTPTDIMELPFKNFIIQLIDENNSIQPPVHAVGKFVSETKYLKKFINVGDGELASESDKPFSIGSHLNYYKQAISTTLQSGIPNKQQDNSNEQLPVDTENGTKKKKESENPIAKFLPINKNNEVVVEGNKPPETPKHNTVISNTNDKQVDIEDNDTYGISGLPKVDAPNQGGNEVDSENKTISPEENAQDDISDRLEKEEGATETQSSTTSTSYVHSEMDKEQAKSIEDLQQKVKEETRTDTTLLTDEMDKKAEQPGSVNGKSGSGFDFLGLKGDVGEYKKSSNSEVNTETRKTETSPPSVSSENLNTQETGQETENASAEKPTHDSIQTVESENLEI